MLNSVEAFAVHHWLAITLVLVWLLMNAIQAMPSPDTSSGKGYKWLFGFAHLIAANGPRLVATLFPAFASKFPFLSGRTNGGGTGTIQSPQNPTVGVGTRPGGI